MIPPSSQSHPFPKIPSFLFPIPSPQFYPFPVPPSLPCAPIPSPGSNAFPVPLFLPHTPTTSPESHSFPVTPSHPFPVVPSYPFPFLTIPFPVPPSLPQHLLPIPHTLIPVKSRNTDSFSLFFFFPMFLGLFWLVFFLLRFLIIDKNAVAANARRGGPRPRRTRGSFSTLPQGRGQWEGDREGIRDR